MHGIPATSGLRSAAFRRGILLRSCGFRTTRSGCRRRGARRGPSVGVGRRHDVPVGARFAAPSGALLVVRARSTTRASGVPHARPAAESTTRAIRMARDRHLACSTSRASGASRDRHLRPIDLPARSACLHARLTRPIGDSRDHHSSPPPRLRPARYGSARNAGQFSTTRRRVSFRLVASTKAKWLSRPTPSGKTS